jgi:uncharacterized protein
MSEENSINTDKDQGDVKVSIDISEDRVKVYLSLIPLTQSPVFTTDHIRKALNDKGIKFGIKEEVLAFLDEKMKYNKRMEIASGIRPKRGRDSTIKYIVQSDRTIKVKKGDSIGEIIPPEEGAEGITVFEEKISPPEMDKTPLPNFENCRRSPENKNLLVAETDGYLHIGQYTILVEPFFKLEKSANTDEAFVTVKNPLQEEDFNAEDLKRFLNDQGIEQGILEEELKNIFEKQKFEQRILIAQMDKAKQAAPDEDQQALAIQIEVSSDKIEAYLTLIPLNESPEFSTDQIRSALAEKEIKVGIKEEVLTQLEKEVKYNEQLLIAAGSDPSSGKDGFIEFCFEPKQKVRIKKGEKIGEIIPPVKGTDGLTVFEEKIPAMEPEEARIPETPDIGPSPDNNIFLVAKTDVYIYVDESAFEVTPVFVLEEATDEYEASVKVVKPEAEGDFTAEDLKKFLADQGIVFGILDEEIEDIFKQEKYGRPVIVARGRRVADEKDGGINYYFDTEIKAQVDYQGNVDFRELNLIQNVKAGDKLAETTSPEKGTEGCTIFGKKTTPKTGVQPPLPKGNNTKPDPENPNILIAGIDGCVKLKGNSVEVEPMVIIKDDVDFNTGNIDFSGSVIVNRDLKSGFKIIATEDVQVNGVVEDAVIEAGGNVLLKTGFIGRSEGIITAEGEVTARFCENQNITSESDIHISDYAMHSKIRTKGRLFVAEQKGLIVGGETYAVKGIEAKVVGNINYTPTALFAGVDQEIDEKLRVKKAHLEKNLEHIKDIKKTLFKFAQRKLIKKPMPEGMTKIVTKLTSLKSEKEDENNILNAELVKLESRIEEFKKAIVIVTEAVYPGTKITIYNRHIAVNEPLKAVFFKYAEQEVVAADMDELNPSS